MNNEVLLRTAGVKRQSMICDLADTTCRRDGLGGPEN
jgi:hypothetical protein